MRWILFLLPFLLAGCLESKVDCFTIVPETRTLRPIILDKCTGKTWMLVYVTLVDDKGKETGKFTYRWFNIGFSDEEPELSHNK